MYINTDRADAKFKSNSIFTLSNAAAVTLQSLLKLAAMGAIGFFGYMMLAAPLAPWAAAVEAMITK